MKYNMYTTFRQGLKDFGQKFTIYYRTSTACTSCGSADPFYGTTTDYSCSTCDGSGLVWSSTAKYAHGILNKFTKGQIHVEDGIFKHMVQPVGKSRATFWIDDVLVNKHSITGGTYFTDCSTVYVGGNNYKPRGHELVGYGTDEYAVVVYLDRIE